MSEINNIGAANQVLNDLAVSTTESSNELGKEEFLELLVAQLNNQDPLNPQENGEFVAQLAQFSALEETQNLGQQFEDFASSFLSSQTLQATSLVGRPVHVASDKTYLPEEGGISVLADIPASTDSVIMTIYNQNGELVESYNMGAKEAGRQEFGWTGFAEDETRYPPGIYSFSVTTSQAGDTVAAPIFLSSNVNSVTIEPTGGLTLNLAGIGPTPLTEVIQVN